MTTRVRLREVAARAGVSEATVSRVLNDRPLVSERTKAIVLDALRALDGPLPVSLHAPGQGSGGADAGELVAVLVPEFDNPIFAVMAQLIADRLATVGLTAVLTRSGTADEEPALHERLGRAGIRALVVVSGAHADTTASTDHYQRLIDDGVAVVFVNGFRTEIGAAPFVSCDDRHAAILAVRHLATLGHRRIGFVSGLHRHVVVQRKHAGYQSALRAAGLDYDDELVVETMFSAEAGAAAAGGLLAAGATAAVAASDLLALGAIRGVRSAGLDVPGDWSVTGYDDTTLMAYTDPALTTVRQPVRAMCQAAADMVADRLAGNPPRLGEFLFRPELVVRASTGPAVVAHPAPRRR